MKNKLQICLFLLGFMFFYTQIGHSAPALGIQQSVSQPDGTKLQVKVFGDEFYNWHESLDGYTLIQDAKTGYWSYATLTADNKELTSTGLRFPQPTTKRFVTQVQLPEKGIRLSAERIQEKVNNRKATRKEQSSSLLPSPKNDASFIQQKTSSGTVENIEMMTILIDFQNQNPTLSVSEVNNLFNQENYTQYGNNGSIKDFYKDISQGKLLLETKVSPYYYRAPNSKEYYATNNYANLHQLIKDALIDLDNNGYDFSSLSGDPTFGGVRALNVLYAGEDRFEGALWPHQWNMPIVTLDGVDFSRYQISGTGSSQNQTSKIGVLTHELGHLLFNWPDTYDYGYDSSGAGNYDLMAYGSWGQGGKNPTPPNPYFRNVLAGWGTITELKPGNTDQSISVSSASYDVHAYQTPRNNELFMLENIQNTKSRYTSLNGSGLLIWHIDTNVWGNNNQYMTESSHYQVSVEQADGAFDLENYNNYGDAFDFFHSGNNASFGANTTPFSKMWNNESSGLEITNISFPSSNMTFTLKANPNADITPPVLTQSNPFNKQKNFDKTSPITLTFNETIQLGPQFNKVKLIELSTKKIISMTPTLSNNQLTFRPTTSLRPKAVYLLQIPQNMIQDTSGNGNKGFKLKFKTKK